MNNITPELRLQKFWILPSGEVRRLDCWHAEWLLRNPDLALRHRVDLVGLDSRADEQEIRLRALRAGFVRMRYKPQGGRLTVEAHHRHFGVHIRQAIRRFVAENAMFLDNILIRLLADDAVVVHHGAALLLPYDDTEKPHRIPLINTPPRAGETATE